MLSELGRTGQMRLSLPELVWMEKFKNIQEGVRGATGGRFTVTEQADRRFGFAKQIGIDASLEAMHKLTVMVEFG